MRKYNEYMLTIHCLLIQALEELVVVLLCLVLHDTYALQLAEQARALILPDLDAVSVCVHRPGVRGSIDTTSLLPRGAGHELRRFLAEIAQLRLRADRRRHWGGGHSRLRLHPRS